jgi:6-pyruvoyltetrahydropterin/6-carboxytetrahydropterin synthase
MGHEGKCAHIHGHNYVAHLTARVTTASQDLTAVIGQGRMPEPGDSAVPDLDDLGMVIDFSVVKEKIGGWIDEHWDHGFVANMADESMVEILTGFPVIIEGKAQQQKYFLMHGNPTAENMARYLLEYVGPLTLKGTGVDLCRVVLHETENCSAEASR